MSLSVDSIGSSGYASQSNSSSTQSEIAQLIQELENLLAQLPKSLSSDNGSDDGGSAGVSGTSGASADGGASGGAASPSPSENMSSSTPSSSGTSGISMPADLTRASDPAASGKPSTATTDKTGTAGNADGDASGTKSSGSSGSTSSAAAVTDNAGGVAQAGAVSGVSPHSSQQVHTGTGDDKTYNVTNDTDKAESFTYSAQGDNKGTMTLQPGETGSFVAGSGDIGVRISPSNASGNTKPNEVLYEDGGAANGQANGASNPDISKVDGDKDYAGNDMNMTVTLSDGKTAGDGDAITPYMYSSDDAAAMGLAGDTSKTANIVMSDAS